MLLQDDAIKRYVGRRYAALVVNSERGGNDGTGRAHNGGVKNLYAYGTLSYVNCGFDSIRLALDTDVLNQHIFRINEVQAAVDDLCVEKSDVLGGEGALAPDRDGISTLIRGTSGKAAVPDCYVTQVHGSSGLEIDGLITYVIRGHMVDNHVIHTPLKTDE